MHHNRYNVARSELASYAITAIMVLVFVAMLQCISADNEPEMPIIDRETPFFETGGGIGQGAGESIISTCSDYNIFVLVNF